MRLLSIASAIEALIPAAKMVTKRDQGQPDHQRRSGGRGAARVAREFSRARRPVSAAQPLERRADRRGQRPHEARAESETPNEHDRRAAAEQERGIAGPLVAEEPEQYQGHAADHQRARRRERDERRRRSAVSRRSPQRRDRRHPSGAQRRAPAPRPASRAIPITSETIDRARLEHQCLGRQTGAERVEQGLDARREQQPERGGRAPTPTSPIRNASTSTEASTCRRQAPSVRSSPNSRMRWATVIEKVLKITNEPTISATAANTSSTMGRKRERHGSRWTERLRVLLPRSRPAAA